LRERDGENFYADQRRSTCRREWLVRLRTYAPLVTLGEGKNSLFASAGTALVLHKRPGDLKTDPAGNAGNHVACGRIIKLGKEKHAATAD